MEEKSGCRSKSIVKKNHEVGVGGEKQAENPRWEAEGHAWRRK